MLILRKKPGEKNSVYVDQVADVGCIDYVTDEGVVKDSPSKSVMVTSESDLDSLNGYEAGTIAFTAGFGSIWQLDADGEWVEV